MRQVLREHIFKMLIPRKVFKLETLYAQARNRQQHAYWSISVLSGPALDALTPLQQCEHPLVGRAMVTDVPAGFVADPFVLRRDGRLFMFFEIYDRGRDRGVIGLATSDDGVAWNYERTVLEAPHHLSYPFVFTHGGDVFLMPESWQNDAVTLYVADVFPHGWRPVADLISGAPFVDPTLISHDGFHYLFAGESYKGVLHLYVSGDLSGGWRRHPRSPVVRSDARHARPAGRFVHDGAGWIRLAQSTEPVYGAYICGFRISELTPDTYREEPLPAYPLLTGSGSGWNAFGVHHLDAMRQPDGSWYAVADGFGVDPG